MPPRDRQTYVHDGKVAWLRFAPMLLVMLLVCVMLSTVMSYAFAADLYVVFLMPLGIAVLAGLAYRLTVHKGHCRSRRLAVTVGCLLGLFIYVGHFQICMTRELLPQHGPSVVTRVDLLPSYIAWRMRSDVIEPTLPPRRRADKMPGTFGQVINWLTFTMDLLIIGGGLAFVGHVFSGRVYDAVSQRWATLVVRSYRRGSAETHGKH